MFCGLPPLALHYIHYILDYLLVVRLSEDCLMVVGLDVSVCVTVC